MIKAGKPKNWKSTDHNLAQLFKELHDCQVFSSEEEKQLAKLSKAGDIEARNLLIRSQLKWAMKMCVRRAGGDTSLAYELFTEVGIDAVIISVKNIDPEKGKLVTYVSRVLENKFITFFKNYGASVIALPMNGARSSNPELTVELRKLADKAKKLESIHRICQDDETEEDLSPRNRRIESALVDMPKDQRYSYDAEEFWELLKKPLFHLDKYELKALREYSHHKQSLPYKSQAERKKANTKMRVQRTVTRMGIAKIRDALNRISDEKSTNVTEFIQKFKEVS